jgi:hypothetical protein
MKPYLRASVAATLLALSMNLAACGTAPSVPAATAPALAFNETGANVIDLKQPNGGKMEVSLQMPTQRKVLAFAEDVMKLKGTISMGDYSHTFELTADAHGKAKISCLNLKPGTWHLAVTAVDRGYKDVGYASTDVYVMPYEVAYESLYIKLDDTLLNKDTGALQAEIITKSGDLEQEYSDYPQWTEGGFADRGSVYQFKANAFYGAYTAFNTYSANADYPTGTWEGKVNFQVGKYGETVYLLAVLEDGYSYPLAKLILSLDAESGYGLNSDFVSINDLSAYDLDVASVHKAEETEYIVTGYHKNPVKVQRFMVIEEDVNDEYKPVGVMSSLFFKVESDGSLGGLIAADFTDKTGYVGSDPSPHYKPDFKVLHIHALDK